MNTRQQIIDSMISMLDQAGEDTSSFFKNIDAASLDEGALETISALLTKTLAPKLGQDSSGTSNVAYAIRNKHGSWYGAPGYVISPWSWYPTLSQARIYSKVNTARRAHDYFVKYAKHRNQNNHHLEGVELVSVRMNIDCVVDSTQDDVLKKGFNNLRTELRTHAKEHNIVKKFPNGTPIPIFYSGKVPHPGPAIGPLKKKRPKAMKKVAIPSKQRIV